MSFFIKLLKEPPECFDIPVIIGNIWVIHIDPVSHFPGKIFPQIGIFHYSLTAFFVVIFNGNISWRILISDIILCNAKSCFNTKLNRQSMSIPACFTFHLITALCFETAYSILDRSCHNVMNTGDTVCRWRTLIKYKLTFPI